MEAFVKKIELHKYIRWLKRAGIYAFVSFFLIPFAIDPEMTIIPVVMLFVLACVGLFGLIAHILMDILIPTPKKRHLLKTVACIVFPVIFGVMITYSIAPKLITGWYNNDAKKFIGMKKTPTLHASDIEQTTEEGLKLKKEKEISAQ